MGQCMVLFYSCKHSPWSHKINLVEFLTLVCKWGLTISKPANIFCKLNTLLSSPNNFFPFRWWNVKGTPYFIAKWTGSKQRNVIKFTWGQAGIKPSYSHQFVICPKERKRKNVTAAQLETWWHILLNESLVILSSLSVSSMLLKAPCAIQCTVMLWVELGAVVEVCLLTWFPGGLFIQLLSSKA